MTEFMVATGYTLVYRSISQFYDIKTLAALNRLADQILFTAFVKTDGIYKLVLEEIFFWLGEMVFGTDMVGENAY